jgi:ribonucleoside-triphosphate reductase
MGYSLQGLNNYIASEISKTYWLDKIYPKEIKEAHLSGDFHLHDLNLLSVYCVGWDLYDLLLRGFGGVSGKVQSKPAKHFRSALGQIVNFFYTLQGEAAGAQAFSNVDTLLAPFIWYDHLSYEEVKQALQEFVFNVNVPTRVGFQTPFTNITLDLTVPSHYAKMHVLRGGKKETETYNEFQREMDMFNQAFLEVMSEGDASGRVFTFPIPTYNITKDDYVKTPLPNGLVFVIDLSDPEHVPDPCYVVADGGGGVGDDALCG